MSCGGVFYATSFSSFFCSSSGMLCLTWPHIRNSGYTPLARGVTRSAGPAMGPRNVELHPLSSMYLTDLVLSTPLLFPPNYVTLSAIVYDRIHYDTPTTYSTTPTITYCLLTATTSTTIITYLLLTYTTTSLHCYNYHFTTSTFTQVHTHQRTHEYTHTWFASSFCLWPGSLLASCPCRAAPAPAASE